MTDERSVKVLHPLRGSEDDREMTQPQRNVLRGYVERHDEVRHRVRPDGTVHVDCVDYHEDGYTETCHVVYRDGLVFQVATYTVEGVQGEPREWEGRYGKNLSYTVALKDVEGVVELSQKPDTPAPTAGQQIEGEIVPSQGNFPPKFKKAQRNGGGSFGGGGGGMSPEREKRIVRQHSQTAAVALMQYALAKEISVSEALSQMKAVADILDKDAGV